MIHDHPAIKWIGAFLAVVSLLATAWAVLWYFEDKRLRDESWYAEDQGWNQADAQSRREITEELATQTLRLEEIERRVIGLETDHKRMLELLGEHRGEHRFIER